MTHLNEEQLIAHFYRDVEDRAEVEAHLAACPSCLQSYQTLSHMLEAVSEMPVPERGEGYGREVYARILPRLEEEPARAAWWQGWFGWHRLAAAGALATLLLAAFLAGRFWPRTPETSPVANAAQIRERVLLVAVGDHLDRSQMILLELANAPEAAGKSGTVDISSEQRFARDLVQDNRLYRQTALDSGEKGVANVLEELERLLLDVANSPSQIPERDWENLRKRIEEKGILFKVRVIGSEVRQREQQTPAIPASSDRGKL